MARVSTFAIALGGSEQDVQKTDHMVRKCYSAVRCLSVLLRDKLHQECLWEDLMQEIEIAAWEAGRKGLSDRDARNLAAKRLYAFIRSNGYLPYRTSYYKPERPFAAVFANMTEEVQEIILSKASLTLNFVGYWNGLKEIILAIVKESPTGISKRDMCCKLRITARELDWQSDPLIKQGLVRVVRRQNRLGRPRTPLLVAASATIPEDSVPEVDRDEEIRRAYLEGKGTKRIARELHHSRRTVRKAIGRVPASSAA